MTLTEALKILRAASADGEPFEVAIVCGFTPVHVQTMLPAHLQQKLPSRRVVAHTGLFGDIAGTLASLSDSRVHTAALLIEWGDLDPRLGFRESGPWDSDAAASAVAGARQVLERFRAALQQLPKGMRVAVSLPTLPLPPLFHTTTWQSPETELQLQLVTADFSVAMSGIPGISVVNSRRLAELSPAAARFDLKSDLLTGNPYTLTHTDAIAAVISELLVPAAPKKGIITDLDDTLWRGIAGEIGPDKVSWDLATHNHLHGLYQKLLAGASHDGVLVAVATKNDPEVVKTAFKRDDILLTPDRVFPVEVHWGAKSGSVSRILSRWNISADSVIFVDDSPMELAEVAEAHPGITCIQFPVGDYAAGYEMLRKLRDLVGKERVWADDALRLQSIRDSAKFEEAAETGAAPEAFLAQAEAALAFDYRSAAADGRVIELVNKTNQFNLNGIRYSEADWAALVDAPGAVVASISYQDRYAKLGKIAAFAGTQSEDGLDVQVWVMSCRAFARRIEHQCIRNLFERFNPRQIRFRFVPTVRNGPIKTFLSTMTGEEPKGCVTLTRESFEQACPPLYHSVTEIRVSEANG